MPGGGPMSGWMFGPLRCSVGKAVIRGIRKVMDLGVYFIVTGIITVLLLILIIIAIILYVMIVFQVQGRVVFKSRQS